MGSTKLYCAIAQDILANKLVTKKNVTILDIREEENVIVVKGSLPGSAKGVLQIYSK